MTRRDGAVPLVYGIEVHQHRFAAWAACRAASIVNCPFGVEQGRAILETSGFTASYCRPEQLPAPDVVDGVHRQWRAEIIRAAKSRRLRFTHGVAAKLVNVYLKSPFVGAGHDAHARVVARHPAIDSVLLRELAKANVGGHRKQWKQAAKTRWSKFGSDDCEQVIALIRQPLNGAPLSKIEEHWRGDQWTTEDARDNADSCSGDTRNRSGADFVDTTEFSTAEQRPPRTALQREIHPASSRCRGPEAMASFKNGSGPS